MNSPSGQTRRDIGRPVRRITQAALSGARSLITAMRPRTRGGRAALVGMLTILFAGGVLRLLFLLAWRPSFFGFPDALTYVGLARGKLWEDPTREVGYPLFLREMHAIFPTHLTWVIALQHLFGLASALLVFLAVRRANGPLWLGLLPAALVALNGAEMFLEHTTLTESLFIFLLSLALYFAAGAAGARTPAWAALAGFAMGLANTVRVVALPLLFVLVIWLLLWSGDRWRRRLLATVAAVVGMSCVLVPYAIIQHEHTGYWGVSTPAGAWNLYSRVAPFADCHKFTPPPGTGVLCEATPPSQRSTAVEQYTFVEGLSPADRAFGNGAGPFWATQASDKKIAAWSRAVILHQPVEYLETVFESVLAYVGTVNVVFSSHNEIGYGYQLFYHDVLFEPQQQEIARQTRLDYYGANGYKINHGLLNVLLAYETVSRVHGPLAALLMLLTFFAPFVPHGRPRQVGLLLFLMAWIALITPAASHTWDARAAIPPIGPLGAAAAIGLWQVGRLSQRYLHK
jgi:Dolichyl-phosphate-mannose-protein mannosyltransferase